MRLETGRMALRPFVMDDLDDLQQILGDPQVMTYVEDPYSPAQTRDFLRSFCIERDPPGAFAAVHRGTGRVIGYVLFKATHRGIYEMGWIFNRAHWRQGYAFEICHALVGHAFANMGALRICAETAESPASLAMMRKLGMRHEGTLRQHVRLYDGTLRDIHWYGLLREEWQPQP